MTKRVNAMLLIGPTGAGKTPFGDYLEEKGHCGTRCLHFDFGHQLRSIAGDEAPPEGFTAGEHEFTRDMIEKGLLLEDEHFHIAEKIVTRFLKRNGFGAQDCLVLNGLPRHLGQARDVDNMVRIETLVVLECTADDVYARIRENTGNDRSGRSDDTAGLIKNKLSIFSLRTEPIIDHYAASGRRVCRVRVTADSTAKDVYNDFLAASQHS